MIVTLDVAAVFGKWFLFFSGEIVVSGHGRRFGRRQTAASAKQVCPAFSKLFDDARL